MTMQEAMEDPWQDEAMDESMGLVDELEEERDRYRAALITIAAFRADESVGPTRNAIHTIACVALGRPTESTK
jgi:hypothetical protein